MEIRAQTDGSIVLRSGAAELRHAGRCLGAVALGQKCEDLVELATGEEGLPVWIVVQRGSDPVRIRWSDGKRSLTIRGGLKLLSLGAWFEALASRPGSSVRLEWHPGHHYIAESSVPLILASAEHPTRTGPE